MKINKTLKAFGVACGVVTAIAIASALFIFSMISLGPVLTYACVFIILIVVLTHALRDYFDD